MVKSQIKLKTENSESEDSEIENIFEAKDTKQTVYFHLFKAGLGRFFYDDFVYGTIDLISKTLLQKQQKNLQLVLPENMILINSPYQDSFEKSSTISLKPVHLESLKYFIFSPKQNLILAENICEKVTLKMYCQSKSNTRIIFEIKKIFEYIVIKCLHGAEDVRPLSINVIFDKLKLNHFSQSSENIYFFNYDLTENSILQNYLYFDSNDMSLIRLRLDHLDAIKIYKIYIELATLMYLIFRAVCQSLRIEDSKQLLLLMRDSFKNSPLAKAFEIYMNSKAFGRIHEILKKVNNVQLSDQKFYIIWIKKIKKIYLKKKIKMKSSNI